MDQLPRLGKRELICLLLFTCNYVVSVRRGFLFLWVFGMGCVILLWHSLSLQYNYFFLVFSFKPGAFLTHGDSVVPLNQACMNRLSSYSKTVCFPLDEAVVPTNQLFELRSFGFYEFESDQL